MSFPHRLALIIGAVVILLIGWQLGRQYQERVILLREYNISSGSGRVLVDPQHDANLSLLWKTWKLLNQYYVEPDQLQEEKLTMGAVRGLVQAVGDPYTTFMAPDQVAAFRQMIAGSLQGIGAELEIRDDFVTVVATLPDSPAERASLLPDDVITKVDDQTVTGLSLDDVVARIRGTPGTSVTLTVYRAGELTPHELVIRREKITVPSAQSKIIERNGAAIGYVSVRQFGDATTQEVRDALMSFKARGVDGVILDLRYNGGGYLDGATEIVSMFLREGVVVQVEQRGQARDVTEVYGKPLLPDMPLVVLINEASASASEIVAGALQDNHRATIVGMQSYGKGTVQDILDLPGGSSLRVTVAHWLTPKGKNLGKEGVTPDITVTMTAEDIKADRDPQLEKAVEVLLK